MKTNISFLEKLQIEIERKLNVDPVLNDIPVMAHRQSDFEACLKEFVQAGVGLCVVVMNPIPKRIIPNNDNIAFEDIALRVEVIENTCTNISERSALSLAEHISRLLHHYKPKLDNWIGWLSLAGNQPWKEMSEGGKFGRYILELSFNVSGSLTKERNVA